MNTLAAVVFSGSTVFWVVIQIVVAALLFKLGKWALGEWNLGPPFDWLANAGLILLVVFFVANALLTVAGQPLVKWW